MKLIGITGNIGKTTTCEMLYQYLLNKGYSVGLMCSNGVYKNKSTFRKDTFNGMLIDTYFNQMLDCDYIVVEINEEWSNNPKYSILHKQYECLCSVSFNEEICKKHQDIERFFFRTFLDINAKAYLCNDKEWYEKKVGRTFTQYSIITDVTYNFDKTTFRYNNIEYTTDILNSYIMYDLSACIGVLEYLNEFDSEILQITLNDLVLRGRMEKYIIGNKKLILDTGWKGLDYILNDLDGIVDLNDLEVVLVPYAEDIHASDIVKKWRKATGVFLTNHNIHVVLTKAGHPELFSLYNHSNYDYEPDMSKALKMALNSNKQFIFVMGNYQYRKYRNIIQEEINNGNDY